MSVQKPIRTAKKIQEELGHARAQYERWTAAELDLYNKAVDALGEARQYYYKKHAEAMVHRDQWTITISKLETELKMVRITRNGNLILMKKRS